MAKRKGLDTIDVAAQAKAGDADEGMMTTAIVITPEQYAVLRAVAPLRAHLQGGVTRVSDVQRDLADRHLAGVRP